jgi:hypothetical protein
MCTENFHEHLHAIGATIKVLRYRSSNDHLDFMTFVKLHLLLFDFTTNVFDKGIKVSHPKEISELYIL